jgi:multicomponent Na+:H+ antiporter subunit D
MSAGAVLAMTGKSKCTELGGLYKTMPWTMFFGVIGALSISSFPATSGFTSKSLILQGAIEQHLAWLWLVLEIASAGVFLHAGIKFPYFVFFAKDSGLRPDEANRSMLTAMGFMSFLCIFLGVYPKPLYQVLPFEVSYQVYTFHHVVGHLQLLVFSGLAFFLFLPLLKRTATVSIDTDWLYRRGGQLFYRIMDRGLNGLNEAAERVFAVNLPRRLGRIAKEFPWRFSLIFFLPVWILEGIRGEQLARRTESLKRSLASGASPVGIGAAAVTAFLLLFFILSGLV